MTQRSVGIGVLKRREVLSVTQAGKEKPQQGTHQHIYTRQENRYDFNVADKKYLCASVHSMYLNLKFSLCPSEKGFRSNIG